MMLTAYFHLVELPEQPVKSRQDISSYSVLIKLYKEWDLKLNLVH